MKTYRNMANAELEMIAGTLLPYERFVVASDVYYFDDDERLHQC